MQKIFSTLLFLFSSSFISAQTITDVEILSNLKKHLNYLASDELEGRGTATEGEQKASDYIIEQFKQMDLKPLGINNSYLQEFTFTAGKEFGEKNSLTLKIRNENFSFNKAGEEYFPMDYSINKAEISSSLVFVGFGITASEANYDDYKNLSGLEGKFFLMELSSPDGMHPHSKYAKYSDLRTKIDLAISKGAIGIIFINSDSTAENPKAGKYSNKISPSKIPVIFLSKEIFKKTENGKKLNTGNIPGSASVSVDLQTITKKGNNVVAYIDNIKQNTVIIGAHYDHLGYGEHGSLHRGEREIHNGADDNASGTSSLIEIARQLKNSQEKNNNYLFIAFSGEELGLYGSNYFTKNPTIKLENVNYMLNMDMVGRFEKDKGLAINGAGTSPVWKDLLNNIKIDSIKIKTSESGTGPSDHTSFYLQNIPVLHFFTGTHEDYHKPSDDADKINFEGMLSVEKFMLALIDSLNEKPKLTFTKTKEDSSETPRFTVTLGVIPDYMYEGEGIKIDGITEGKPASKAGFQKGDIVVQMGENKTSDMMSYMKALSNYQKGDSVTVKAKRGDKILDFQVTF